MGQLRITVTAVVGLLAPALALLLAACGGGTAATERQAAAVPAALATMEAAPTATATPAPTPVPPPSVLKASASVRADNPLIVEVGISLDRPAQVYVVYENQDAGRFRTKTTDSSATEHLVPVVRLRPLTTYSYRVFTVDPEGRQSEGVGGAFTTGSLPEALSTLKFKVKGKPTTELVMLDYGDVKSSYIIALDKDSKIIWYYASPNAVPDVAYGVMAIAQKPNYNLVYNMGHPPNPCCLREITPLGEIVDNLSYSDLDGIAHHDHLILPRNRVLYLAWVYRVVDDTAHGGNRETVVVGDSLRIWDQNTGLTHEVWNAFDSISTDIRGGERAGVKDWAPLFPSKGLLTGGVPGRPNLRGALTPMQWTLANSLAVGPEGNYVVGILRLFQIISISPDFQTIQWVLGGPNSDYTFDNPSDQPKFFHSVSQLPHGNILVFDNGTGRLKEEGGEYSRVIELALDRQNRRATKVWEYRPKPDIFSRLRSSAQRLDNGNTLISFEANPRVIVEVGYDGTEVWKLEISGPTLKDSYRAYPLGSIMGETAMR